MFGIALPLECRIILFWVRCISLIRTDYSPFRPPAYLGTFSLVVKFTVADPEFLCLGHQSIPVALEFVNDRSRDIRDELVAPLEFFGVLLDLSILSLAGMVIVERDDELGSWASPFTLIIFRLARRTRIGETNSDYSTSRCMFVTAAPKRP